MSEMKLSEKIFEKSDEEKRIYHQGTSMTVNEDDILSSPFKYKEGIDVNKLFLNFKENGFTKLYENEFIEIINIDLNEGIIVKEWLKDKPQFYEADCRIICQMMVQYDKNKMVLSRIKKLGGSNDFIIGQTKNLKYIQIDLGKYNEYIKYLNGCHGQWCVVLGDYYYLTSKDGFKKLSLEETVKETYIILDKYLDSKISTKFEYNSKDGFLDSFYNVLKLTFKVKGVNMLIMDSTPLGLLKSSEIHIKI